MKLQNQADWRRVTILIIGLVALSLGLELLCSGVSRHVFACHWMNLPDCLI
jgi:hypothetical protein